MPLHEKTQLDRKSLILIFFSLSFGTQKVQKGEVKIKVRSLFYKMESRLRRKKGFANFTPTVCYIHWSQVKLCKGRNI